MLQLPKIQIELKKNRRNSMKSMAHRGRNSLADRKLLFTSQSKEFLKKHKKFIFVQVKKESENNNANVNRNESESPCFLTLVDKMTEKLPECSQIIEKLKIGIDFCKQDFLDGLLLPQENNFIAGEFSGSFVQTLLTKASIKAFDDESCLYLTKHANTASPHAIIWEETAFRSVFMDKICENNELKLLNSGITRFTSDCLLPKFFYGNSSINRKISNSKENAQTGITQTIVKRKAAQFSTLPQTSEEFHSSKSKEGRIEQICQTFLDSEPTELQIRETSRETKKGIDQQQSASTGLTNRLPAEKFHLKTVLINSFGESSMATKKIQLMKVLNLEGTSASGTKDLEKIMRRFKKYAMKKILDRQLPISFWYHHCHSRISILESNHQKCNLRLNLPRKI
jgi:hypothetical protein